MWGATATPQSLPWHHPRHPPHITEASSSPRSLPPTPPPPLPGLLLSQFCLRGALAVFQGCLPLWSGNSSRTGNSQFYLCILCAQPGTEKGLSATLLGGCMRLWLEEVAPGTLGTSRHCPLPLPKPSAWWVCSDYHRVPRKELMLNKCPFTQQGKSELLLSPVPTSCTSPLYPAQQPPCKISSPCVLPPSPAWLPILSRPAPARV